MIRKRMLPSINNTNYNMISDSMVLLYEALMVQNLYFHSLYGKNTLKILVLFVKHII